MVVNQNAKHAAQSAFFKTEEKRGPGLSRSRPQSPAWQEKSSAKLNRSKKQKREKITVTEEKSKNKNLNRSEKKALKNLFYKYLKKNEHTKKSR